MNEISSTRREFLQQAAVGTLGMIAAGNALATGCRVWAAPKPHAPKPTADTLIVLWMAGGMAHTETRSEERRVGKECRL